MEFNQKLQELRKAKGLTQEELAQHLYVSRTAVSKWESGRGYPSIDSLKAIAAFFSVTIDDLLSSGEALDLAEKDGKQKTKRFRDLVFSWLDTSAALFFFLPIFRQSMDGAVQTVSLPALNGIAPYLKTTYGSVTISMILLGLLALLLPEGRWSFWEKHKNVLSLLANAFAALLFIISPQPYAAAFLFFLLLLKGFLLLKQA